MKKIGLMLLVIYFLLPANGARADTTMGSYCAVPPFLTSGATPNVLIILDNSNSMDEDFQGNAVGSYASDSKSVVAKKSIMDIINAHKDKLRFGLMTYKLPTSGIQAYYLHNSPYFVSYNPKSYCPNPSQDVLKACEEYCGTGSADKKTQCESGCKSGNPSFDVNYFDEIINNYPANSEQRKRYCRLIYPKTQRLPNTSDPGNYLYVKQSYPFYAGSPRGTGFCYSSSYNSNEGTPYDSYNCYEKKTGQDDGFSGYSNFFGSYTFRPTDSDIALGFLDFGRRLAWYQVGRTWFSNSSPGDGYLHIPVTNATNQTEYAKFSNKLDPKENNEAGYMSCNNSDKNQCSYIVNAGLTPMGGTLQTAIDYFKGNLRQGGTSYPSPLTEWCQRNFIVLVTDGLPSVDESGTPRDSDTLLPAVINKLNTLRNLPITVGGKTRNYEILTYILGVGLSNEAKSRLDQLAVAGGTAVNGHAYYADNPDELRRALDRIFVDILNKSASGTAASVLSERVTTGTIVAQAVFYPEKYYEGNYKTTWSGNVYGYWFFTRGAISNIREDTNQNKILEVEDDNILKFKIDEDLTLNIEVYQSKEDGSQQSQSPVQVYFNLDDIKHLFDIGNRLRQTNAGDRKIYGVAFDDSLKPLTSGNSSYFASLFGDLSGTCLSSTTDHPELTPQGRLINYIRGEDIRGCRPRETGEGVWKLGDITYSTPKISDYPDKYGVIFVGSNDGMLHAFRLGSTDSHVNAGEGQVVKLCDQAGENCSTARIGEELWAFIPKNAMPYLKFLADPNYCHLYYVDLAPHVFPEDTDNDGNPDRWLLIGGMRMGGATGCTKKSGNQTTWCNSSQITPPGCTPGSVNNCLGLSSYFALDVTDPEDPKFLWEFTDPYLGFTYSGPAFITRNSKKFVMFVSGPNNYKGEVFQDLSIFVLKLKDDGTIEQVYKFDGSGKEGFTRINALSSYNNSFGGRLNTIDDNGDGQTDMVIFGVNQKTGSRWQGNLIIVRTTSDDPESWEFDHIFTSAIEPITAKVEYMKCFGMGYIYFGTGRWFFKNDEEGQNNQDTEKLYGVRIDPCLRGGNCNISSAHNSRDVCDEIKKNDIAAWYVNDLEPKGGGYFKERTITDPTPSDFEVIFFTTMQPNADVCGFGGRTRMWALNCATGAPISDTSCSGYVVPQPPNAVLLLQLSGANIKKVGIKEFVEKEGRATEWYIGTPPEAATTLVKEKRGNESKANLLLWIER